MNTRTFPRWLRTVLTSLVVSALIAFGLPAWYRASASEYRSYLSPDGRFKMVVYRLLCLWRCRGSLTMRQDLFVFMTRTLDAFYSKRVSRWFRILTSSSGHPRTFILSYLQTGVYQNDAVEPPHHNDASTPCWNPVAPVRWLGALSLWSLLESLWSGFCTRVLKPNRKPPVLTGRWRRRSTHPIIRKCIWSEGRGDGKPRSR